MDSNSYNVPIGVGTCNHHEAGHFPALWVREQIPLLLYPAVHELNKDLISFKEKA